MRPWIRVMGALLSSQYALMLEYRAEIVLWALSGLLPLIMLGVWSGAGAAAGLGLGPEGLTRHFLAAFVIVIVATVLLLPGTFQTTSPISFLLALLALEEQRSPAGFAASRDWQQWHDPGNRTPSALQGWCRKTAAMGGRLPCSSP